MGNFVKIGQISSELNIFATGVVSKYISSVFWSKRNPLEPTLALLAAGCSHGRGQLSILGGMTNVESLKFLGNHLISCIM